MRVLNNPTRKKTCICGAELEFDDRDIKHGGDSFRQEREDYIICPCCGHKIVLYSCSTASGPFD